MSLSTFRLAILGRWRPAAIAGALIVVIAVGAGVTIATTGLLRRSPTDVVLTPKSGAREVGLDEPLKLAFTRPVPADRVEAALVIEPVIQGAMATSGSDGRHFSWAPTGPWNDLTTYTVTIKSFKDRDGVATVQHTGRFTTTIVPRVTALTTENGATTENGSELPLASTLKVTFNAAMEAASVKLLLNGAAANLTWSDDAKAATFSTKGIAAGDLVLSLGSGGKDRTGHALNANWTLDLNLVFAVTEHTVPLQSPALVQIPNDNYGARDQSGLQAASIVFEYLTEGGITRLTALFMNVPDVVGPIRSGRLISFKLTRHYHGINYFSGLSAGSFAVLAADPVPALYDTQGIYYRTSDRSAPNNLYIKGSSIQAYQDKTIPAFSLTTAEPSQLAGEDAPSISVPEHNSNYTYDAATGTYLKTEEGRPMNDALVQQPLHIRLLVVMHTRESITNIVEDVGGGRGRDFDMESGGPAEFYYRGKKATGRWSAADRASQFQFTLDSGQAITLPKNLVWIDVVS